MTIENYKQLDQATAKELNVKEVVHEFATTDKGDFNLVYNLENNEYYWVLDGVPVDHMADKLNPYVLDILKSIWLK